MAQSEPIVESEEDVRRKKAEAFHRLLDEWMADESGYDEETWPLLKKMMEEDRLSPRKRFAD
jgi:hypothetical protein